MVIKNMKVYFYLITSSISMTIKIKIPNNLDFIKFPEVKINFLNFPVSSQISQKTQFNFSFRTVSFVYVYCCVFLCLLFFFSSQNNKNTFYLCMHNKIVTFY